MPEDYKDLADIDEAFPIGHGQTISQPYTVSVMLDLLQPKPGNKVLEIGYGSGWLTTILSELVGSKGKIYSYEIIPELANIGRDNIKKHFGYIPQNIRLFKGDYLKGINKNTPYDRIISSASFSNKPTNLMESLSDNGVFIYPTEKNDIRAVERKHDKYIEKIIPGFVFVPIKH